METPQDVVLPLHYWPSVDWCRAAAQARRWWLQPHDATRWQRQQPYNRCWVAATDGPLRLVVPGTVQGGKPASLAQVYPVPQAANAWVRQHQEAIRSAYGRSPYWEVYGQDILALVAEADPARPLPAWTWRLTAWLLQELGLPAPQPGPPPAEAAALRFPKWGAPAGCPAMAAYPQRFPGWQPHLSALDLLLNTGGEAALHLQAAD